MAQVQVDTTKPHVRINLRKRNHVKIDAQNYQGVGCSMATKKFADLFGSNARMDTKPEMHIEPEVNTVPVQTPS